MSFSNKIGYYALYYYGKRSSDSSPVARISLSDVSNQYFGNVYFFRDDQTIQNNSANETTDPKRVYLKMHERQLDRVVDMLRNEKPCSVFYYGPTLAIIYTGREPVGEEETEE